jgi:hypothetical protein
VHSHVLSSVLCTIYNLLYMAIVVLLLMNLLIGACWRFDECDIWWISAE